MHQQTTAHHEHGGRAHDGQATHQPGRECNQATPQGLGCAAGLGHQPVAHIIHAHDAGHQTIDKHGNGQCHGNQHHCLLPDRLGGHRTQRNRHDFCRENEVGAYRALDLLLLIFHGVHLLFACGPHRRWCHPLVRRLVGIDNGLMHTVRLFLVEDLENLFHAFKAEKRTAQHQQRSDQPGNKRTDQQGCRHQNRLVHQRALGHGPDHGQLPVGLDPGNLLGIECQIVAKHTGCLLHGHLGLGRHIIQNGRALARGRFGHQRHIIEQGRNIIEQHQKTRTSHRTPHWFERPPSCLQTMAARRQKLPIVPESMAVTEVFTLTMRP